MHRKSVCGKNRLAKIKGRPLVELLWRKHDRCQSRIVHQDPLRQPTHLAAILAALHPRVSCNRELGLRADSVNQGVGLTTTQRIAMSAGGCLYIASGDAIHSSAAYCHLSGGIRWQGVAIGMECKRQRLPEVHVRELLPPFEPQPGIRLRFE